MTEPVEITELSPLDEVAAIRQHMRLMHMILGTIIVLGVIAFGSWISYVSELQETRRQVIQNREQVIENRRMIQRTIDQTE